MNYALKIISKRLDSLIDNDLMHLIQEPSWLSYFTRKVGIKDQNVHKVVSISEIIYLQAQSNYTLIFTEKGKFFSSKTLKVWTDEIQHEYFIRPHHSFYVNKMYIDTINKSQAQFQLTNGTKIPISRKFKGVDQLYVPVVFLKNEEES